MTLPLDVQMGLTVVAVLGMASAALGAKRVAFSLGRGLTQRGRRPVQRNPAAGIADHPVPFGWSTAWLALQTRDTLGVVTALELTEPVQSGWQAGIAAVHDDRTAGTHVFVSPPLNGWTLVVGYALPHPGLAPGDACTQLLQRLARSTAEVQYFYSEPSIGLFGWSRFLNGKPVRRFAAAELEILLNDGPLTDIETAHGIASTAGQTPAGKAGRPNLRVVETVPVMPNDDLVIRIAASWSVDPTALTNTGGLPSLGFLGRAPATWRRRSGAMIRQTG